MQLKFPISFTGKELNFESVSLEHYNLEQISRKNTRVSSQFHTKNLKYPLKGNSSEMEISVSSCFPVKETGREMLRFPWKIVGNLFVSPGYPLESLGRNLRRSCRDGIKRYKEFCSLHGLRQLIQEATHITETSETLLDHIISNSTQKVSQHGVVNLGLSDHQMIYCTRKSTRAKNYDHKYIKIRSMKNYSRELFLNKLKLLKFPSYSEFVDINAAYSHFLQLISSVIDEIAPMKEIHVRGSTQEWMDEEVLEGIRIRNKLLSKFKRTKTHTDHVNFRKSRNNVLSLIEKKKEKLCCWKTE